MFGRLLTLRLASGLMINRCGFVLNGGFVAPWLCLDENTYPASQEPGEIIKACDDAHFFQNHGLNMLGASTVDETS